MISLTLENAFILTVFQLLVAGLILCSTGASLYLQKDPSARKVLRLITLAFLLYSAHFLLEAGIHYHELSSPATAVLPRVWNSLADALESATFICLGLAYLPQRLTQNLYRRSRWIPLAVLGLSIESFASYQQWNRETYGSAISTSLLNGILLTGVAFLHLRERGRKGLFSESPLYVLSLVQMLQAATQRAGISERLWLFEQAATLIGLGLFAIVLDSRSRNLQVRFFLRLNLTFVVLASLLILIVAETERREYLHVAESHTEDLSEFLRGHLLYFHHQGKETAAILSSPEIIRRITADFGRLPDLRRVRINFEGWSMDMGIREDWSISHEVHAGKLEERTLPPEERGRVAALTPVPIIDDGRNLGQIELEQGLRTINARVAQQMKFIFLTFTIAVFIAAVLFGLTVQRANKTIQSQFEELEKTHGQLAHVERLATVGQLAGGLAHEINNPAGIIVTTSEYALRQLDNAGPKENIRGDLEAIRRQARRISNIVNGLLTFSRPMLLQKRLTDVNAVLRQCLGLLAPRFREQHIQLEQQLSEPLPRINADPDRLEQVFVNLLNNAADAMPQGGTIWVESAFRLDDGHAITVSMGDTGCGIPEENLQRIFDPFFSTKPKGQGTGLGLSVSYGVIRDHGGKIGVESQPNRGTLFQIQLPIKEAPHESL